VSRRIKEARLTTQASLNAVECDTRARYRQGRHQAARDLPVGEVEAEHPHHRRDRNGQELPRCRARRWRLSSWPARSLRARVPRLVEDLAVARVSGAYTSALARLSRIDVLILDDFLLAPMKDAERRDLLEVLEDRYERAATIVTSQLSSKTWHAALGDPTIADAICDRLVHNAYELALIGGRPCGRRRRPPSLRSTDPRPSSSLRSDQVIESSGTSDRVRPE